MQQTLSGFQLLSCKHQYPQACLLEGEIHPLDASTGDLYITLTLNQEELLLLDGKVKFGFKGGYLKLNLDNCILADLEEPIAGSFVGNQATSSLIPAHITPSCDRHHLTWELQIFTMQTILQGRLSRIKLGTIQDIKPDSTLEVSFEIDLKHLGIIEVDGLWPHDINPNQHGILERAIARHLRGSHFKNTLSYLKFSAEGLELPKNDQNDQKSQETLKNLIQQLNQAKHKTFLELAEIAEINPLIDLAGGNFVAGSLSGLQLSGAILDHVNLRGADLTDIDLSEAKLRGARLSGADLSGAYLENVDLRDSDLHSASLALANLIGADLRSANLQQTNLSNANLTSALVEQAKFANNLGISEEMRQNLQARGAIFL
jgi:uncharacterized protein YjbI with pentapeptide repeats